MQTPDPMHQTLLAGDEGHTKAGYMPSFGVLHGVMGADAAFGLQEAYSKLTAISLIPSKEDALLK
jgi:hypothetical protein